MTLREQAEQIVKDEYCTAVCDGFGQCCYIMWGSPYDCEGFAAEVEYVLKGWATEEKGREDDNKH